MAVGNFTTGRRVYFSDKNEATAFRPGDYGKDRNGRWWCRGPRGDLGQLDDHTVTEYDDGAITVEPSIQIIGRNGREEWHGYLRNGVWQEV